MTTIIELPFRLPGLNEYTRACRAHWSQGATMKKNWMSQIMVYLPKKPIKCVEFISITYIEPNRRRDIDNIFSFGSKLVLDALVKIGFLPDDSQRYIRKLEQSVVVEKGASKIIIIIKGA